jgi:hypothetical protein
MLIILLVQVTDCHIIFYDLQLDALVFFLAANDVNFY